MENKIAEVSLVYRTNVKSSERAKVTCSEDAFEVFYHTWEMGRIEHIEEFKVLLLNRANRVLGICQISQGGITGTVVDVKLILQYALKANASSIIMAHNHPSGNLMPSEADIQITRKIKEAGKLIDLSVLDHLIIAPEEAFHSMSDNGEI